MRKIKVLISLLLVLLLCSCGGGNEDEIKATYKVKLNVDSFVSEYKYIQTDYTVDEGALFAFPTLESKISYKERVDHIHETNDLKFTRSVCNFEYIGWEDEDGFIISPHYIIESDKEFNLLYNYTEKFNALYFHLNGGLLSEENIFSKTVNEELILPIPTKENYTFSGWYRSYKLVGSKFDKFKFTFDNTEIHYYAKFDPSIEYMQRLIDEIPEEITIFDIDKIIDIRKLYYSSDVSIQKQLKGIERINELYKNLDIYYEAYDIYYELEEIYSSKYNANLKTKLDALIDKINTFDEADKKLILNLDSNRINTILDEVNNHYELYKEDAVEFDKKIARIPIYLEKYYVDEIKNLYNEYNGLDENIKEILFNTEKLNSLYNNTLELEKEYQILYMNTNTTNHVYTSKQQFFEAFFTDFYYYICAYHGIDHLEDYNLYNVNDFVTLAGDFYGGGTSNLYGIGNAVGIYMIEKDVNGILANQSENGFFGFCYQNNLYQEILPFFINYFAFWRIDEKYANTSNYGADIFAEGWAPTVDIAKFFYYNETTSPVKTERMIDCMTKIAGVVYDVENNPTLRGYIFEGWYDNPEFSGSPIYDVSTSNSQKLYAKWNIDYSQIDKDQANMVDIYIYNLTTSKAVVNEVTVTYVFDMYNSLSNDAKLLVTKYNTLLEIKNKL